MDSELEGDLAKEAAMEVDQIGIMDLDDDIKKTQILNKAFLKACRDNFITSDVALRAAAAIFICKCYSLNMPRAEFIKMLEGLASNYEEKL